MQRNTIAWFTHNQHKPAQITTAMPDTDSKVKKGALTVDEAREAILAMVPEPTSIETVALDEAVGRTVANNIVATYNVPHFRNSAMDGYAIRHKDRTHHNRFKIIGTSLAGHPFTDNLSAGEAIRVTTGAAVPDNADAIIIQENASRENDHIITESTVQADEYIRNPGDDIQANQILIEAKKELSPSDTGLLAAQGIKQVEVFPQARIGVFSTGDELREPQESLGTGQIFDSNRTTIQSLLKLAGFESVDLGICKDDPEHINKVLKTADDFDFILSSGGVSVGEADYVKTALEKNGELLFWKVAMKPGKPLVTGRLDNGSLYFGLPGNPVSSMVTCIQFVIPAIRAFSGSVYQPPLTLQAKCLSKIEKAQGRFEFQRGRADIDINGELTVSTTGLQDSHVLNSMSQANCFVCLEQFATGAKPGEMVSIVLFQSYPGFR